MIFFLYFKNYFLNQHIKTIQNIYKKLTFNKKNKIFKNTDTTVFSNAQPNSVLIFGIPSICPQSINQFLVWSSSYFCFHWVFKECIGI